MRQFTTVKNRKASLDAAIESLEDALKNTIPFEFYILYQESDGWVLVTDEIGEDGGVPHNIPVECPVAYKKAGKIFTKEEALKFSI